MIDKITDVFNKNNVTGCFVTKDLKSDKTIIYNPEKAFKRLRPASSFKIFNSLVALELNFRENLALNQIFFAMFTINKNCEMFFAPLQKSFMA